MKSKLLLLVFLIIQGLTIHLEGGCEVRSKWKIDYRLPNIAFSGWVPHGDLSKHIITIETHFKDYNHPVTFDKIKLYGNRIQLDKQRNGKLTTVLNQTIDMIDNGWADFTLTVDSHYGLKFLEKTILAPNVSVDYMPMSLVIKGSNITLNYPSKMRTWDIAESSVSVPLDDSKEHSLIFFSTRKFSPSISLEGRTFKLGWDNETLTTIPSKSQPLPPFVQHQLMLTCQKHLKTTCTLRVGEEMMVAETMFLADIPQSIFVKGMPGDEFFVFFHQDDPISTPNEVVPDVIETSERFTSISEDSSYDFFVAFVVTLIICIVLCTTLLMVVICYIYRKTRKAQEKKIDEEQSREQRTHRALEAFLRQNQYNKAIPMQFLKRHEKEFEERQSKGRSPQLSKTSLLGERFSTDSGLEI